ncbi:MAG: hypothetical protein JW922_10575 [Paludibacteraceae bacterium]|nr:hypothetical protein [Paludibacteraceae bacterium]
MNKYFIIAFTLFFLNAAHSQSNIDYNLLDSIKCELGNADNIKEAKVIHEKFKNGSTKILCLLVKYKTDSIDRYWLVGPAIRYFKNGQVKGKSNTDFRTNVVRDTTKLFFKDGAQKAFYIYPKEYSDSILCGPLFKLNKMNYYYFVPISYIHSFYYRNEKGSFSEGAYKIVLKPNRTKKKHGIWKKYDYKKGILSVKEYDMGTLIFEKVEKQTND